MSRLKKNIILGFCIGLVLLIASLVYYNLRKRTDNEYVIQAVVKQMFTCPNEELIDLFNDMSASGIATSDEVAPGSIIAMDASELNKKLEKMYAKYIADEWYESFQETFFSKFIFYSIATEYQIKIDNIEIVRSDTAPSNYSFTIHLIYGPSDGEMKNIDIEGSAQFAYGDGKISFLQFLDNDLVRELRSSIG